jgi:hypothetical protein
MFLNPNQPIVNNVRIKIPSLAGVVRHVLAPWPFIVGLNSNLFECTFFNCICKRSLLSKTAPQWYFAPYQARNVLRDP